MPQDRKRNQPPAPRHLAKTLSFACVHFTVAFLVGYLLTGSLLISSALALIEPLCNTVAYYFHEKAWNYFGKRRSRKLEMAPESYGHDKLSGAVFPDREGRAP